ncbi:MAG: HD family phosphohydrolase [Nitrospinaceae bacterium]|nr:MAG: HD family phosphohydrolase [Nitrospinaceae bacterium]
MMNISELIQGDDQLATLPEIFYKLNAAIEDPDCTFDDIGEIISLDPGLTARLLKIVNSAFYGFSTQVETVTHALTIIGTDQLAQLVLATSVMGQFKAIPTQLLDMDAFWRHSISAGLASRSIAALSGEYNVERFFVAGLLHDVGRLVLCIKIPNETGEIFKKAQTSGKLLCVEEQKALGFDHAEVGGELLKAWNLPDRLVESVAYHHAPEKSKNHPQETAVVNLADAIAYSMKLGSSGESVVPPMEPKSWELIGLPESLYLPMIKDKIEQQFEEVAGVFLQTT